MQCSLSLAAQRLLLRHLGVFNIFLDPLAVGYVLGAVFILFFDAFGYGAVRNARLFSGRCLVLLIDADVLRNLLFFELRLGGEVFADILLLASALLLDVAVEPGLAVARQALDRVRYSAGALRRRGPLRNRRRSAP